MVRYPAVRTDDEVRDAHATVRAIYEHTRQRVAWVVDASEVRDAPATQRKIVSEHEQQVKPLAERWCAGLALVLPNPLVRGFFTAVTWIVPLSYPHRVFADAPSALVWARAQLEAHESQSTRR